MDPLLAQALFNRSVMAFLHAIVPEPQAGEVNWYYIDQIFSRQPSERPSEVILDTDEGGIPVDLGKW